MICKVQRNMLIMSPTLHWVLFLLLLMWHVPAAVHLPHHLGFLVWNTRVARSVSSWRFVEWSGNTGGASRRNTDTPSKLRVDLVAVDVEVGGPQQLQRHVGNHLVPR